MRFPRRIIAAVRSSADSRAVLEAGALLARAFDVPVSGVYLGNRTIVELCDLPPAFRPAGPHSRGGRADVRCMMAAIEVEARLLRADLTRRAIPQAIDVLPGAPAAAELEELAAIAERGDVVVASVDLSLRPLGRAIRSIARFRPAGGGLFIVPERAPGHAGNVLALTNDGGDGAVEAALGIAKSLRSSVLFAIRSAEEREALRSRAASALPGGPAPRFVSRADGRLLDAADLHGEHVRMVVCDMRGLETMEFDQPTAIMRRLRAPILILDDAEGS